MREYVLQQTLADYRNLSVHQCDRCAALVVEDFMVEHMQWHNQHDIHDDVLQDLSEWLSRHHPNIYANYKMGR